MLGSGKLNTENGCLPRWVAETAHFMRNVLANAWGIG